MAVRMVCVLGMCGIAILFFFGFEKNSYSVRNVFNPFDLVWKTLSGSDIVVICYLCNTWVLNLIFCGKKNSTRVDRCRILLVVDKRMDEVQWMYFELVDDRKGIWPQNLHQLYLMECTFPPLLFHHHLSEKVMVRWCYEVVWRVRVRRNWLAKARFPLPELTARVNGPSWLVTGFHYPSTRAVLTGARFH